MTKASPKLIGSFVLGAIALLVVGLLVFGAGNVFRERHRFVSFFDGSVAGLSPGAPVTFRGVPVGAVTEMQVRIDRRTLDARIPVYYEFDASRFTLQGDPSIDIEGRMEQAIRNGLRAQLVQQSLVTGQLAIQLTVVPGSPIETVAVDGGVPEIPTIPSGLEALKGTLEELPLVELVTSATRTVNRLDELLAAPEIDQILGALGTTLQTVDALAGDLRIQVPRLLAELERTSQGVQTAVAQGEGSLSRLDAALVTAEQAFRRAETALASADSLLDNEGRPYQSLLSTLQEAEAAARSIRRLADAIERNPSMFITGRR